MEQNLVKIKIYRDDLLINLGNLGPNWLILFHYAKPESINKIIGFW